MRANLHCPPRSGTLICRPRNHPILTVLHPIRRRLPLHRSIRLASPSHRRATAPANARAPTCTLADRSPLTPTCFLLLSYRIPNPALERSSTFHASGLPPSTGSRASCSPSTPISRSPSRRAWTSSRSPGRRGLSRRRRCTRSLPTTVLCAQSCRVLRRCSHAPIPNATNSAIQRHSHIPYTTAFADHATIHSNSHFGTC